MFSSRSPRSFLDFISSIRKAKDSSISCKAFVIFKPFYLHLLYFDSRQEEDPTRKFFYRTSDEGTGFLYVSQTEIQRQLLKKYGATVLIDATYNTSKYALPLFLLVVRTNCGYLPVAEFIPKCETTVDIREGLSIVKSWNPGWQPQFVMTDYSDKQIGAVEDVFPTTTTLLCAFHREQAWDRWLRRGKSTFMVRRKE